MNISNLDLPEWVLWIAQDEDGAWWGYEAEPLMHESGWYENEVGRRIKLQSAKTNPGWQTSLRKVKREN